MEFVPAPPQLWPISFGGSFFAPALCWCAWTMEPSSDPFIQFCIKAQDPEDIVQDTVLDPFPETAVNSLPRSYRSGRSRQGAPLRAIQMMPLRITRLLFRGRPCLLVFSGWSRSVMRFHSSSVSSYRLNIMDPPFYKRYLPFTFKLRQSTKDK